MAKLTTFMISESYQMNQDLRGCQLINPLAFIAPAAIPGNFSFVISIGLFGLKKKESYTISVSIEAPDKTENTIIDNQSIALPQEAYPSENIGISMNIDIRNFEFRLPGSYIFTFTIDGEIFNREFPVYGKK